MIVKITDGIREKYNTLFVEAYKYLKDKKILDNYNLVEIADEIAFSNYDKLYYFDVIFPDSLTRIKNVICIPSEYHKAKENDSSGGSGVCGGRLWRSSKTEQQKVWQG